MRGGNPSDDCHIAADQEQKTGGENIFLVSDALRCHAVNPESVPGDEAVDRPARRWYLLVTCGYRYWNCGAGCDEKEKDGMKLTGLAGAGLVMKRRRGEAA